MSNYRKLEVWEDACTFAEEIYKIFGSLKDFGFKDQITRSAVSIASNIAEGSDRGTDKDFARFICIAKSSCEENRTQLYIAVKIQYISEESFQKLDRKAESISKRLGALIKYLRKP